MREEAPIRGCLLDTNIAIFSMFQSKSLSSATKEAVAKGKNYLSVISYWEVMLKIMKGHLDVGDPQVWWREAQEQLSATPLLLRPQHVAAVQGLPPVHKDPFDRMLIAQATVEGLVLVSSDAAVRKYASKSLKVVS